MSSSFSTKHDKTLGIRERHVILLNDSGGTVRVNLKKGALGVPDKGFGSRVLPFWSLGEGSEGAEMELAVRPFCLALHPQIINQQQRTDMHDRLLFSRRLCSSASVKFVARQNFTRDGYKVPNVIQAISSDLENVGDSVTTLEDFTVTTNGTHDREIKIRVDVSGARTRAIFDDVFSKLVAAAQPIPGFRRVKGGKTPDIPKDVLLLIIGPSKVNKSSIKKIINTTVAEYVQKESLKVSEDLRVEQSYEELESTFKPGKDFGFDAILQLQETRTTKS